MNQLQIFNYEKVVVRTVMIDGTVWFVAKDVCDVLDIGNSRQALSRLDSDEKNTVIINDGIPGNPNRAAVNEFGLNRLILTSRKEEAKRFQRWIIHEVIPEIRRTGSYNARMPYHMRRSVAHQEMIPHNHFSMLSALTQLLISRLEWQGYTLPEHMLPDISEGLMFNRWLRKEKEMDPTTFPTYPHTYEDGRVIQARLYPNELWADLVNHFFDVWLPKRSMDYFEERDPSALAYLPKVLTDAAKTRPLPAETSHTKKKAREGAVGVQVKLPGLDFFTYD